MKRPILSALALSTACAAAIPAGAADHRSFGTWRNPKNSVHVRAQPCGKTMCGVVVWASDKAKADAARGSDAPLVGSTLFRDFRQERPEVWRGKVYVPDIGKTFSGTISVKDANHLEGKGCLVGRVGCKSQIWTRIGG
ncbi:hypothetical protein GCM10007897_36460 [Sphingobium jiangsuense]|uniref:Uncharacterized protein (DUF2147 family) n=1 Tax=Sphingobium jiangsuense TaxID=870476 RepID=A0A7W6BEL2_9SPHN|nr:DUF2147 domain-containing protein [Sphingobium jiangsuense]MBB3924679.1 uncharacterized protein (DUF2147 family) [Sphingobium jiangsuense]GLT02241.1 hypothetical protein GCM10007897_36460 [Sphingobium jiangsuense]